MPPRITVYEKPTCTTCRKLAALFKENGVDYDRVDYFIDPLGEDQLRGLLRKAGLSAFDVLRRAEPVYKELKISEVEDEEALIKLIVENPALLQRPIVEAGERAVLARPVEKALELIRGAG
jgi:arsenate reductase